MPEISTAIRPTDAGGGKKNATLTEGTRCANKHDRAVLKHGRTTNRCKTHQSLPFRPISDFSASCCLFLHCLFQEYQYRNDIQSKVWLVCISWSVARKFPCSVKYSHSSAGSKFVVTEKKWQIKYFVQFCMYFSLWLVLCGFTSVHLQRFYWQRFSLYFPVASDILLPTGRSLPNKCRWSGISVSWQRSTAAETSHFSTPKQLNFLMFLNWHLLLWLDSRLAFSSLSIPSSFSLNTFPALLIYFFLQRASQTLPIFK